MTQEELQALIEAAFAERGRLGEPEVRAAIEETIALLDRGELRAAVKHEGTWNAVPWVKQAILLYFAVREIAPIEMGAYEAHDKIPLKRGWKGTGVRVVPPGTARYGS